MNFSLFNIVPARPTEHPPEVAKHSRSDKMATVAANTPRELKPAEIQPVDDNPTNQVVANRAMAVPTAPVDGFALRSSAAPQFVADVQVPANSWFSLASSTTAHAATDCASGTCQLVPVKTADRKLNTLLEWSPTPQLAAEQAARDCKLVYLIHVSGNFAQPGFT